MYRRVREHAELCREDLLAFTERLVRTPSHSFHEEAVAEIVEDGLEDLHYDLVFRDEVGNVVGLLAGGEEGPTVLLNSHLDVQRLDGEPSDRHDPPEVRIERGRVWGPGAADCKAGLASQVFAGYIIDRSLPPLCGTLVVAATVAQEEGNGAGVRHLVEQTLPKLGVMPDLAVLGEPTGLLVYSGHDGRADIDVRVAGHDANVAGRAIELIQRALWSGDYRADWKGGGSSLQMTQPVCGDDGGSHHATLCIRCRVKSNEAVANCVGAVKRVALDAVESLGDASVDVRVHSERRRFYTGESTEVLCWNNPWACDPSAPLVQRALSGLSAAGWKEVTARAWGLKSLRLVTAGSLLGDSYRIPTLCFGPGDETGVGTTQESVDVEALVDAVSGTAALVHGAIGTPSSLVRPTDRLPRDRVRPKVSRSGK